MKPYRIECRKEGPKYLATVSQFKSSDQREGDFYEILAVALGESELEAVQAVVAEAFEVDLNG